MRIKQPGVAAAMLIAAAPVLILGGIEAACRYRLAQTGSGARETPVLRDPFTGWRNNPAFGTDSVVHNAQGFRRNRDVSLQKSPGLIRIFLLGGSAAYGDIGSYPELDDRFSKIFNTELIDHHLEAKLQAAFPLVRWEVINGASVGYNLSQQLLLIESVVLRYRPDYVILMDGYNDVRQLGEAPDTFEPFSLRQYKSTFDDLANPQSWRSLLLTSRMLLHRNSALFRMMEDHSNRFTSYWTKHRALAAAPGFSTVEFSDLSAQEQVRYKRSRRDLGYYARTARQINAILKLDHVAALFLLQPVLILSHKPLTDREELMRDAHRRITGKAMVHAYEHFYPAVAGDMRREALREGFRFEDLTSVFDSTQEQAFSDYCHLTPTANRIIAERIFKLMYRSFEKSARAAAAGESAGGV